MTRPPLLMVLTAHQAAELRTALLGYRAHVRRRGARMTSDLEQLADYLTAATSGPAGVARGHDAASAPPAVDTDRELLTAREAARRLAVSERTVRRLADRGDLPRVRVGQRSVRYRRDDVDEYARRHRDERP